VKGRMIKVLNPLALEEAFREHLTGERS